MSVCSVVGCTSDSSNDTLYFHSLPKNEPLAAKWILFCGNPINLMAEHFRVCSRHFVKADYQYDMTGKTKQLRNGAVPSIFKADLNKTPVMEEFNELPMNESHGGVAINATLADCPTPMITELVSKKVKVAMSQMATVPECPLLRKLFDDVTYSRPSAHPTVADLYAIYKVLQPNAKISAQAFKYSNLDKVLQYYLLNSPMFEKQRETIRMYNQSNKNLGSLLDGWYKEYFCYAKVKLDQLPSTLANRELRESSTQTDSAQTQNSSKFALEINGPHDIMDSISISTNENDVVTLRFSEMKRWKMNEANLKSLLNLPQVSFEFKLNEDIWFKRTMTCEYERYIMKTYEKRTNTPAQRVRTVRQNDIASGNVVYTHGFISMYLKELSALIKKANSKIGQVRKDELLIVLNEFLADTAEINLYNNMIVPTNALVSFVIGDCEYVRRKENEEKTVNYVEYITPIAFVLLRCFDPRPTTQKDLAFSRLNYFGQNMSELEALLTSDALLSFGCMQCKINFPSSSDLFQHFRLKHHQQAPMTCDGCKMSFNVPALAAKRWRHTCANNNS